MRKLIVASLLSVTAAHAQTLEELGLRALTESEDRAVHQLLTGVETLLPVPDSSWERIESDGTAEKAKRLGTLQGGDRMFGYCEPANGGCFPDDVSVQLNYQPKGAAADAKARAAKTKAKGKAQGEDAGDPLGTLMALADEAQEAGAALDRQLVVFASIKGEPAPGECQGDRKPTEARPDFMFNQPEEEFEGDRVTARFVFGTRMCSGDIPLWPRVTAKTPLAPVRAIEVVIEGPPEAVRKLAQRVDRKAFAARLGAVAVR